MKSKFLIVFMIVFVMLFSGCGLGHIEDENGPDDYSLAVITNEDLLGNYGTNYFMSTYSRMQKDNLLTGSKSSRKFTGVDTLEEITALEYIKIEINSNVKSGNFKIVIIGKDLFIDDINVNEEYIYTNNSPGKYKIVIAGESANFSVSYKISYE